MLRRLLATFLSALTLGLSKEEKLNCLTKLVSDLLIVNDRQQTLKRTEVDRLQQLLTLGGGSAPEALLTDVALNTAERLLSSFSYEPEILLPWSVSLLREYVDTVRMLRLVDLLEELIEWPEFNLLAPGQQHDFRLRLSAKNLCSFGEHDLTSTVLSLAGIYYSRSTRYQAA